MTNLILENLSKSFPTMDRPAVDNVNIKINSGELIALLGPSGCGKTTILKMITGLFQPTNGDIKLDEKSLLSTPTEKRGVVMVFQNYLLFPYMSVNENVGFEAGKAFTVYLSTHSFYVIKAVNCRRVHVRMDNPPGSAVGPVNANGPSYLAA